MNAIIQKSAAGMHAIVLDEPTAAPLRQHKRVICQLNGQLTVHCALLQQKDGSCYVHIGSAHLKKLGLKLNSVVSATFRPDDTPYQFAMPEELKEVLDTDPEANEIFHRLTPGNQRGLMALVQQVKSMDKRIERALKVAERLKQGIHSVQQIMK